MNETIVINLGGSILSLSNETLFDFSKANQIKELLMKLDNKFIISVGGGFIARKYQKLLKENEMSNLELDQVGIAGINLNAVILRGVFGSNAEDEIYRYEDFDTNEEINFERKIMISAAGAPGHSSDWDSVYLSIHSGSKKVFNLTNTDGVYSSDPKKDPAAKKIDNLSWSEYFNIIGNAETFEPGAHYPIDPIAAKMASENEIEYIVLDGSDLMNLEKALKGESFVGTIIK